MLRHTGKMEYCARGTPIAKKTYFSQSDAQKKGRIN